MTLRGILLDKDGTIFDFAATWGPWLERVIAEESGPDLQLGAAIAERLGFDRAALSFAQDSSVIAGTPDEQVEMIAELLPPARRVGLLERIEALAAEAPLVPVTPDVPALLAQLRAQGAALGVLTNDAEAPTWEHLRAIECADSFDFVAGYDSGFGAKPQAGGCLAFARQMGLKPEQCAMVGDSLTDLRAGAAAGMIRVGVLTGPATHQELAPEADVVLGSICELPAWIETL